jgi:DNA replication and repair protein RecF
LSETAPGGVKPATPIAFQRLVLSGFRNFERGVLEPGPRLNVIAGDNGQGKTSLLEALYFVATTRSFRSERVGTLVRHGQNESFVRADISEGGRRREQRAALVNGVRRVTLDGKRPERLIEYAQRTPVVAFHPGDLELVSGASSLRRRLLDRAALFVDPAGFEHKPRYERVMKARQRALEERGERAPDLDAYEALAANEGARYQLARQRAAEALRGLLAPAFARLAPGSLELSAVYAPGGTTDQDEFRRELAGRRTRDRARRSPSFGPSKDDLELSLDARMARTQASQGQQRILTLALKLAELECIRDARGVPPVLLLDDVSSELDPTRTGAVYEVLAASSSQVFVTTTRPELFPTPADHAIDRRDFVVEAGVVRGVH